MKQKQEHRGEALALLRLRQDISRLEDVIGGDIDLSQGFACLRCEEGELPEDTLVFLRLQLLGQVRQKGPDEFLSVVKRSDGRIIKETFERKKHALADIVAKSTGIIAGELERKDVKFLDTDRPVVDAVIGD